MGTSNFHSEKVLYTVTDCIFEDEDGIEYEDEFIYQDTVDNITYELKQYSDFYESDSIKLESELRSFPATSIGAFYEDIDYLEEQISINVIALVRSGYYEGFNFDYEVDIEWQYSHYEDGTETVEDMLNYDCVHQGLMTAHKQHLIDKIDNYIQSCHDRLCATYSNYSDGMRIVARFSNGETIYEKVA